LAVSTRLPVNSGSFAIWFVVEFACCMVRLGKPWARVGTSKHLPALVASERSPDGLDERLPSYSVCDVLDTQTLSIEEAAGTRKFDGRSALGPSLGTHPPRRGRSPGPRPSGAEVVEHVSTDALTARSREDRLYLVGTTTGSSVRVCYGLGDNAAVVVTGFPESVARALPMVGKILKEKLTGAESFLALEPSSAQTDDSGDVLRRRRLAATSALVQNCELSGEIVPELKSLALEEAPSPETSQCSSMTRSSLTRSSPSADSMVPCLPEVSRALVPPTVPRLKLPPHECDDGSPRPNLNADANQSQGDMQETRMTDMVSKPSYIGSDEWRLEGVEDLQRSPNHRNALSSDPISVDPSHGVTDGVALMKVNGECGPDLSVIVEQTDTTIIRALEPVARQILQIISTLSESTQQDAHFKTSDAPSTSSNAPLSKQAAFQGRRRWGSSKQLNDNAVQDVGSVDSTTLAVHCPQPPARVLGEQGISMAEPCVQWNGVDVVSRSIARSDSASARPVSLDDPSTNTCDMVNSAVNLELSSPSSPTSSSSATRPSDCLVKAMEEAPVGNRWRAAVATANVACSDDGPAVVHATSLQNPSPPLSHGSGDSTPVSNRWALRNDRVSATANVLGSDGEPMVVDATSSQKESPTFSHGSGDGNPASNRWNLRNDRVSATANVAGNDGGLVGVNETFLQTELPTLPHEAAPEVDHISVIPCLNDGSTAIDKSSVLDGSRTKQRKSMTKNRNSYLECPQSKQSMTRDIIEAGTPGADVVGPPAKDARGEGQRPRKHHPAEFEQALDPPPAWNLELILESGLADARFVRSQPRPALRPHASSSRPRSVPAASRSALGCSAVAAGDAEPSGPLIALRQLDATLGSPETSVASAMDWTPNACIAALHLSSVAGKVALTRPETDCNSKRKAGIQQLDSAQLEEPDGTLTLAQTKKSRSKRKRKAGNLEILNPLPQQHGVAPSSIVTPMLPGGLLSEDMRSSIVRSRSLPAWAARRAERVVVDATDEAAEDPDLACYLWDRSVQRPMGRNQISLQSERPAAITGTPAVAGPPPPPPPRRRAPRT